MAALLIARPELLFTLCSSSLASRAPRTRCLLSHQVPEIRIMIPDTEGKQERMVNREAKILLSLSLVDSAGTGVTSSA